MKMKVCLLTNDYPPIQGGISNYVKGLHDGFRTLGHGCSVLFLPVNSSPRSDDPDVITRPVKGRWTFSRRLSCRMGIVSKRETILKSDIAVISAWSPLGMAYKSALGRSGPRTILLTYGNDVLEPLRSRQYTRRMKETFDYFDLVTAISHYTAQLCSKVTERKVYVIGGGLDQRLLQIHRGKESPEDKKELTFLSVGRLIERKGCDLAIQSLAKVGHLLPQWRYVIIGSGPYERGLRELVSKLNLNDHVAILTHVDFNGLLKWYSTADVFIMVSKEIPEKGEVEGLGLVYMEAGAARIPVIAGKSGGIGDVVKNGVNGLLVDPSSTEEISQAVLKLYGDADLRNKLGEQGRELAEKEWRWEKVAERIVAAVKRTESAEVREED